MNVCTDNPAQQNTKAERSALRRGFTLIEMLVVIGIISLISTIALININSARVKALNAKGQAEAQNIIRALLTYKETSPNGFFPMSRCDGLEATCLNKSPVGTVSVCRSFTRGFCGYAETGTYPGPPAAVNCSSGEHAGSVRPALGTELEPYLSLDTRALTNNKILSPVKDGAYAGADTFIYISYFEPTTAAMNLDPSKKPGAYLVWYKAGCQQFTANECPGVLLRGCKASQAVNSNGCAIYLGDDGNPAYGLRDGVPPIAACSTSALVATCEQFDMLCGP